MLFKSMTPRTGYALGFLICLALLGFALYLQHYEQQDPCPLCILQRIAFLALAAVFLVAALHGPGKAGSAIYSGMLFIVAGVGAAIAARHVWLQHLPRQQVPECGPGLEYMLQKLPLSQALGKIFKGSGECAEVGWTFLGLSIAEWSLAWFALFGAFAVWLAFMAMRLAKGSIDRGPA
jgi:disulfide bond formation protein DsbB